MTQIKGDQSKFKDTIITGVNSWGGVPSNAATTINVSAGNGDVIDSTTNRRAIVRTHVIWAADATFSITMGTTFGAAYVYIDSAGVIQQQTTKLTRLELRTKIFLCTVEFLSGAITAVVEGPKMQQSTATILSDLLEFVSDSSKLQGAVISPVTAQLQAFREAGSFFEPGISTTATPNDPNVVAIASDGNVSTPMDYIVLTQDGGLNSSGTETFPKLRNTTGSTTVALTGNKATIHVFAVLGGINILQMGQVEYNTANDAVVSAQSDLNNFTFAPGFENAIILAQIVIGNGAADFADTSKAQILNKSISAGGGVAAAMAFPQYFIKAEDFTAVNNSDFAFNGNAANFQDDVNNGFTVALHDDTVEQGKAFQFIIPTGSTSMKITTKYKAMVAPPAARTAGQKFYERASESTVDAWGTAVQLDDMDFETDLEYNIITQTITLATLGLTAGQEHQMIISRDPTPVAGTNLVDDMGLRWRLFEFI